MNTLARRLAAAAPVLLPALLLLSSPLAAQQWTGRARIDGKVANEKGEPIAGAVVQLRHAKEGPEVKTDKNGRWAYLGLTGGSWDVDVSAPGYETRRTTVQLSEITRIPPMDIRLKAETPQPPPEIPKAAGPDVIPLVEKGNELLQEASSILAAQRGDAVAQAALAKRGYGQTPTEEQARLKFAEAREQYEKALALVPDNAAILRGIARAQYGEKKKDEAIVTLKRVLEKEPGDTDTALLLANLQVEQGKLEDGKATLAKVPPEAIKDPGIYVNLGVVLLNKNQPQDAWEEFDKAVKLKPDDADSYFYRGLAAYQSKKKVEAKADFEKYLELAPAGDQAKDARELLKTIK